MQSVGHSTTRNNLYVQYGCGLSFSSQWRNFDGSPRVRLERTPLLGRLLTGNRFHFPREVEYGDIVRGLPVAPGSCRAVYCSHVLEHLALADCEQALRNTRKILMPGGIFRLVLPDLQVAIQHYSENTSPHAATDFMRETLLGLETRQRNLMGMLRASLGNSPHLWMWDYPSMHEALEKAGFVNIRRAVFGDASDPMFHSVEERVRWRDSLGLECQRPA